MPQREARDSEVGAGASDPADEAAFLTTALKEIGLDLRPAMGGSTISSSITSSTPPPTSVWPRHSAQAVLRSPFYVLRSSFKSHLSRRLATNNAQRRTNHVKSLHGLEIPPHHHPPRSRPARGQSRQRHHHGAHRRSRPARHRAPSSPRSPASSPASAASPPSSRSTEK